MNARAVVLIALCVQLLVVGWTFPVTELLTSTPLLHIDHAYHWYQVHIAVELAKSVHLTGYDPYFAAGYVGGISFNASARGASLLAAATAHILAPAITYKLVVFTVAAMGPALAAGWAFLARARQLDALIGTYLLLLLWWASVFRWYHTAGMTTFVFASFAALPYSLGCARSIGTDVCDARHLLGLGLLGAAGFFIHPLFAILAAVSIVCLTLTNGLPPRFAQYSARASAIGAVALAPNLPWMIAQAASGTGMASMSPYMKDVGFATVVHEMFGIWQGQAQGARIYTALLIGTLAALVLCRTPQERRLLVGLTTTWLGLTAIGAFGALSDSIATLQPNRFRASAYVFLAPAAAIGLRAAILATFSAPRPVRFAGIVLLLTAIANVGMATWEMIREVTPGEHGRYGAAPPEVVGVGDTTRWILQLLASHTDKSGRGLFETSHARVHDGAHIAGYLALTVDREFIGGPYPHMFKTGSWDGVLFGHSAKQLSTSRFSDYARILNVGWVIAHSPPSKRFLDRHPLAHRIAEHNGVVFYRLDRELSFFLEGSGRVSQRGINQLKLTDLHGNPIVLSYRYEPGLRTTTPGLEVVPVYNSIVDDYLIGLVSPLIADTEIFIP